MDGLVFSVWWKGSYGVVGDEGFVQLYQCFEVVRYRLHEANGVLSSNPGTEFRYRFVDNSVDTSLASAIGLAKHVLLVILANEPADERGLGRL